MSAKLIAARSAAMLTDPKWQEEIAHYARFRGCSDSAAAWDLAKQEIEEEEEAREDAAL
jgi:hypothetical protein